jgi:predicted dehydrogenase
MGKCDEMPSGRSTSQKAYSANLFMRTESSLTIGIVGAGAITRNSHLPVLINMSGVKIGWVYDQRPEVADALADAYGVKSVHSALGALPACDVSLVAIPVEARGEYLRIFAARGTAVLCEKPFAMSAAEHSVLLANFAPCALGAGYMRRMFRSALLMRRIVQDGMFGPLLGIDVSEGNRSKGSGADSSFLDDPLLGSSRGVLADLGSHSVDLALFVSGATAFDVQLCSRIMDGPVDRKVEAKIELSGAAQEPDRRIELDYTVSWLDRQDNMIRLRFPHATVWSGLGPAAEVYVGDPTRPRDAIRLSSEAQGASTYNQAFFLEWQNFLGGFRGNYESLVSARSALLTTSLVESLLTADVHK